MLLVSESKDSKKLYALKCIRVQLPEHESRVMNEINAHERIIHDNVLKLLEYQLVKENDKLVMGRLLLPYYPNGTVQDLIDRVQTIEIDQVLIIATDICKGLQAFQYFRPYLAIMVLHIAT